MWVYLWLAAKIVSCQLGSICAAVRCWSPKHTNMFPRCLASSPHTSFPCITQEKTQTKETWVHQEAWDEALLLSFYPCRRSTRWWALWSWWKWTRMAWRPSRGWTRSSPRWIRTTTTRSRWRSSKRRPRATRPSYYCCSVTSRNRPGGERSPPPAATDCTERNFMFHSVCSYFHWKKNYMLGLPFNGSASCVWNTRVHENVICYKKIYTQHTNSVRVQECRCTLTIHTHTHTHLTT